MRYSGDDVSLGVDHGRCVEEALGAIDPLGDAPGDDVDSEPGGPGADRGERWAVDRFGGRPQRLAVTKDGPLLRQDDELGAVGGRRAHEPLGGFDVAVAVRGRVELHRRRADLMPVSLLHLSIPPASTRLTDQSIRYSSDQYRSAGGCCQGFFSTTAECDSACVRGREESELDS